MRTEGVILERDEPGNHMVTAVQREDAETTVAFPRSGSSHVPLACAARVEDGLAQRRAH